MSKLVLALHSSAKAIAACSALLYFAGDSTTKLLALIALVLFVLSLTLQWAQSDSSVIWKIGTAIGVIGTVVFRGVMFNGQEYHEALFLFIPLLIVSKVGESTSMSNSSAVTKTSF